MVKHKSGKKQPKVARLKILLSVAFVLIIIAAGGFTLKAITSSTTDDLANASDPTANSTVLVFQTAKAETGAILSTIGLDGLTKSSISPKPESNTFNPSGISPANLGLIEASSVITTDKNWSKFAVLSPSLKAAPVATSLNDLLTSRIHPTAKVKLSSGITAGKSTLYAVLIPTATDSSPIKFVKIDLVSGKTTELLSVIDQKTEEPEFTPLRLITMSRDNKTAYLISVDAEVGGKTTDGMSLISCDTSSGKFTITKLPGEVNPFSASISKDGRMVAFTEESNIGGLVSISTHIFNAQTGKETKVEGEGLFTNGGATDLRFSPDGTYLSEVGHFTPNSLKEGMALQIISTSSNKIVKQIELEGMENKITGFDWAVAGKGHKIVYTTNRSETGSYDGMIEAVHSYDVDSGKIYDFPAGSGELIAVLNYAQ